VAEHLPSKHKALLEFNPQNGVRWSGKWCSLIGKKIRSLETLPSEEISAGLEE
jgi:hypothetical protein